MACALTQWERSAQACSQAPWTMSGLVTQILPCKAGVHVCVCVCVCVCLCVCVWCVPCAAERPPSKILRFPVFCCVLCFIACIFVCDLFCFNLFSLWLVVCHILCFHVPLCLVCRASGFGFLTTTVSGCVASRALSLCFVPARLNPCFVCPFGSFVLYCDQQRVFYFILWSFLLFRDRCAGFAMCCNVCVCGVFVFKLFCLSVVFCLCRNLFYFVFVLCVAASVFITFHGVVLFCIFICIVGLHRFGARIVCVCVFVSCCGVGLAHLCLRSFGLLGCLGRCECTCQVVL